MTKRQKIKFIKNLTNTNENELKMLSKILITKFLGDLNHEEIKYLNKITNLDLNTSYNYPPEKLQYHFENIRDQLINKLFTNFEKKNKILKEKIFPDTNKSIKKHAYIPSPYSNKEITNLINSKLYSKNDIKKNLKKIHNSREKEIKLHLNLTTKAFFENLTEEEKNFANIKNQDDLNEYKKHEYFKIGYEICYKSIRAYPIPIHKNINHNYLYKEIYYALINGSKIKKDILKKLKENKLIKNKQEELLYKKELDNTIINYQNAENIKKRFLQKK